MFSRGHQELATVLTTRVYVRSQVLSSVVFGCEDFLLISELQILSYNMTLEQMYQNAL